MDGPRNFSTLPGFENLAQFAAFKLDESWKSKINTENYEFIGNPNIPPWLYSQPTREWLQLSNFNKDALELMLISFDDAAYSNGALWAKKGGNKFAYLETQKPGFHIEVGNKNPTITDEKQKVLQVTLLRKYLGLMRGDQCFNTPVFTGRKTPDGKQVTVNTNLYNAKAYNEWFSAAEFLWNILKVGNWRLKNVPGPYAPFGLEGATFSRQGGQSAVVKRKETDNQFSYQTMVLQQIGDDFPGDKDVKGSADDGIIYHGQENLGQTYIIPKVSTDTRDRAHGNARSVNHAYVVHHVHHFQSPYHLVKQSRSFRSRYY